MEEISVIQVEIDNQMVILVKVGTNKCEEEEKGDF